VKVWPPSVERKTPRSVWAVGMSRDRHQQFVVIAGIDGDLRNLLAVAQAEMCPGFARVDGFINAVAHGTVGPLQSLAAAYINHVRVGRRDSHRADRAVGWSSKIGTQVVP